jgi:hypothetical protein
MLIVYLYYNTDADSLSVVHNTRCGLYLWYIILYADCLPLLCNTEAESLPILS